MSPPRLAAVALGLAGLALPGTPSTVAADAAAGAEPAGWICAEPGSGVPMRSAALALSGQQGGDLEVGVGVYALAAPEGPRHLVFLDVAGLTAATGAADRVDLFLYVLDADEAVRAFLAQAFPPPPAGRQGRLPTVKVLVGLELDPGLYSLRILVRERSTGRFGLRARSLTASVGSDGPGAAEDRHLSSGPVATEPAAGWWIVEAEGEGEPPVPHRSWQVEGRPVVPSLGDEPASDPRDRTWVEIAWREGDWSLRPVAAPPAGGAPVAADDRRTAPLDRRVWPGYSQQEARFIDAIARLADDDAVAAAEAVSTLEAEGLRGSPSQRKRLDRGQMRVAGSLARADSASLAPLIAFYEGLFRLRHAERRYQLATHARNMVGSLARIYGEVDQTREAGALVADALVSMAGYVAEVGSVLEARDLCVRALDYDATHHAALAAVAAIDEAYGDYDSAGLGFRRLLELHPEDEEARLRLAINLRREEDADEAIPILASLTAPGRASWIRALAHQELARLLDADEAEALLHRGIADLPEHAAQLRVLLASLLDRRGRHAQAREILRDFEEGGPVEEPSARLRYTRWETALVAEARRSLAEQAARRLPALAAALDDLEGDPEGLGP